MASVAACRNDVINILGVRAQRTHILRHRILYYFFSPFYNCDSKLIMLWREKKKNIVYSLTTRDPAAYVIPILFFLYISLRWLYMFFFLFAHRIKTELNMTAATLRRRNKLNILNGFTSAPQQKIKRGREMLGRQQCCVRLVYANA